MSGIYIQNMEMPKSCWDCFACHDGWCIINQKIEGHRTVTHSCPLVAVPKHGDLIDRDMVLEKAWDVETFVDAVKYAPTIIPAEEGEG